MCGLTIPNAQSAVSRPERDLGAGAVEADGHLASVAEAGGWFKPDPGRKSARMDATTDLPNLSHENSSARRRAATPMRDRSSGCWCRWTIRSVIASGSRIGTT